MNRTKLQKKELNEMEINNISFAESKILFISMLRELSGYFIS